MVKKSKLLAALDAHKGRDYEAEKKKKQLKAGEKRKKEKIIKNTETEQSSESDVAEQLHLKENGEQQIVVEAEFEDFDSDEEDSDGEADQDDGIIPQPDVNGDASASEAEQDSDVDLSDLEDEDREDVVPHQRMTINNGPALTSSRKRVAVVSDKPKHPFHFHNSLVSSDQPADELIPDAMDDETRELMFYKIARDATISARGLLKKENVPFSRPSDYFAEMVKTEDHMDRIKKKMHNEASSKKAAEEARKLRDAKKFGKQIQVAKEQERAKEKRDTLNKIKDLKRKRKDNDNGRVNEGDDLFEEVNVDNDSKKTKRDFDAPGAKKRQKKDAKFGFGGKKRFSKSGTAESSGDMRGFSVKKMKGKGSASARRPGKSRRASARN